MREKDLRGKRYGKLVCVEPTGERGADGCMVWRCRCDCGGECRATTAQLNRGDRKSCGCMRRQTVMIRTGERFGMLVVTGDAGVQDRRRRWRCRCDCGNECVVSGTDLSSGRRKSCGCMRPTGPGELAGRRFGSLTVTGYDGYRGGRHFWSCRCDCGQETVVSQSNLLSGHTKSCGCLQREAPRNNLKLIDGTSVKMIENRMTKTPIKSNTSGYNGVYRDSRSGLWQAQITFKGRTKYLGSFTDIRDAVKARRQSEEVYDDFLEWYYSQQKAQTS